MKRNVITGENSAWLTGHREEFDETSGQWKRLLRSEWVFARMGEDALLGAINPTHTELEPDVQLGAYLAERRNDNATR